MRIVGGVATSFDYSQQAQTYDTTRAASPSVLGPLRQALAGRPVGTLVDLGGGTGNYAQELAAEGWRTTVVDRNGAMLARAADKGLPVCRADIAHVPFPDQAVDAAMIVSMLHHVPDWATALAEAHRVVRPGGVVALMGYTRSHMAADVVAQYFPLAMAHFTGTHQTRDELLAALPGAEEIPVFYDDLVDGSMAALGRQPELILDPGRRRQTSFIEWVSLQHPEELQAGLARLEHDLSTGARPQDANRDSRAVIGDATVFAWTRPTQE